MIKPTQSFDLISSNIKVVQKDFNSTLAIMKKLLFIICVFCSAIGNCQKINAVKTEQISINIDPNSFAGYDALGSFYYIEQQTLFKQNSSQTWQYKNPQLGKISRVDVMNPLKVVVFFEMQNTVVLLDAQLNETQKINFNEKTPDIFPSAVGLASGNRLWLYNSLNQRIGLYDYTQNKWQPLGTTLTSAPVVFGSDYNYFFWTNTNQEVYRLDVFGKTTMLGLLPKNDQFVWANEQAIIYQSDGDLYWFNFNDNKRLFIEIDKKSFKKFTYKDQILSIFTDQGISNYKINLP